jgi:type II secretory pathway pseudopilin PulG
MPLPPARQIFLGVVIGVVVLAVVTGLLLLGSPGEARIRRLDERRVADLRDITSAIDLYRSRHSRLPASMEELSAEATGRFVPRDPTTRLPYEYHPLGPTTYDICARFERPTDEESEWFGDPPWNHGAGRQCFRRETRESKK